MTNVSAVRIFKWLQRMPSAGHIGAEFKFWYQTGFAHGHPTVNREDDGFLLVWEGSQTLAPRDARAFGEARAARNYIKRLLAA